MTSATAGFVPDVNPFVDDGRTVLSVIRIGKTFAEGAEDPVEYSRRPLAVVLSVAASKRHLH